MSPFLLLTTLVLPCAAVNAAPKIVTVAQAAPGEYLSFPDIVTLDKGSLLVAYRTGKKHTGDDGKIMKASGTPDGRTWSKAGVLYDDTTVDDRDPSIMLTSSGTLILNFFKYWYTEGAPIKTFAVTSQDNGVTVDTNTLVMMGENILKSATSSKTIELKNGDLLTPVYTKRTKESRLSDAGFYRSRDGGRTWGSLELIAGGDDANLWLQEPSLLQLRTGRIIAFIRTSSGTAPSPAYLNEMYRTYSDDNGATWAPLIKTDTIGQCPALFETRSGKIVLAYRGLDNFESKKYGEVIVRYSGDGGDTWGDKIVIYKTPKDENYGWDLGYPSIAELGNGKLIVVYYTYRGKTIEAAILKAP